MKRFLLFALVATMFAACATDATEDVAVNIETPETLTVSLEEESRIQLQNGKTVWTAGDVVSVFYRSNANQKWQFQGETGERTAQLKRVDAGSATQTMQRVVIVYPYNTNYYINTETYNVEVSLPAEQTYLADSYGLNGNIMVSSSEYNQFALKSVCGWLKVQLTGKGEVVKSITLKGNNGEQVAGQLYVNSQDATAVLAADSGASSEDGVAGGSLVFDDTILTEVVLNCGEGVTLGTEPTAFYIALPPQTFEKGLTIDIKDSNDWIMTKSTDKAVTIERNAIQPMATFDAEFPVPNDEIWYTSSDGNVVTPHATNAFGANIISNTYENGKGVIKFDAPITSIGYNAFYKSPLTSVTVPDGVTSIGQNAFYECTSLTSIIIPDSVTSIVDYAFSECSSLASIAIPDGVTSIGYLAFVGCSSLQSIKIPDSVTRIRDGAFARCSNLQAFYGKYASEDNRCLVIDGVLHSFAPADLASYAIPDSATSIGYGAFGCCNNLTSIIIPNSVTEIGKSAFTSCESLPSITIPDSVTSIRQLAFAYCNNLTSVTIGNSVTRIESQAFYECSSLTSITIPDSVTRIGSGVFYNCSNLQAFYGKYASEDNRCLVIDGELNSFAPAGLTSYVILDNVVSIGTWAFSKCSNLTSIIIPDGVTSIGYGAFYESTSLTKMSCNATTPPAMGFNALYPCHSDLKIYVPSTAVDDYKNAEGWRDYADRIYTSLQIEIGQM